MTDKKTEALKLAQDWYDSGNENPDDFANMIKQVIALAEQPAQQQEPVANELKLHIIRKWPEGFQDRLQHVWLDVVSFIPDVKLYDLQRVLAEFGFTMKVYEGDPPASKPWVGLTDEEERKAFEQWYVCNAFDYERNPIGSRECGLQWSAWKARAAHGIMSVPDGKGEA